MRRLIYFAFLVLPISLFAQDRLASDFEIAQMREQIARSSDFLGQLSARLNLGDLYQSRNDTTAARDEYERALSLALKERISARRASDIAKYATVTAYAGLAQAKLNRGRESFELFEEAIRYESGSSKTWNLYATALRLAGRPAKSVSAARNAVAIAATDAQASPSTATLLDLAINRYTLAAALIDASETPEAELLLRAVIDALNGPVFDEVRRQIERTESFEIYSTARGEASAYLSLLNRSQLRLANLLEASGKMANAREFYERVLDRRTDDATALTALARLTAATEQSRYFAAAFDANPFSLSLIRSYQRYLVHSAPEATDASTAGGKVRRLIEQIHRGERRGARSTLDQLQRQFPGNATLETLRRELDVRAVVPSFLMTPTSKVEPSPAELRTLLLLIESEQLDANQRSMLDGITFTARAVFSSATAGQPGQTVFQSGLLGEVPFRFAQPSAFFGSFAANEPLRLTFRILGVTRLDETDALLVEPIGLEAIR